MGCERRVNVAAKTLPAGRLHQFNLVTFRRVDKGKAAPLEFMIGPSDA